jgi:hypothetical protein
MQRLFAFLFSLFLLYCSTYLFFITSEKTEVNCHFSTPCNKQRMQGCIFLILTFV